MRKILLTITTLFLAIWVNCAYALEYEVMVIEDSTVHSSWGVSIWGDQVVGTAHRLAPGESGAALWHGFGETLTILHPTSGYVPSCSWGTDVYENQQVGYADKIVASGSETHAMLWEGTAASAVDLHPAGFDASCAYAVCCGKQGGNGYINSTMANHALIWMGSAQSFVDLHPAGFTSSWVKDMTCDHQVGYGTDSNGCDHALLWGGSAQSVVDLHPEQDYWQSVALGVYANRQVGYADLSQDLGMERHAMLWYGSAASAVNLNPSYCTESIAHATSRNIQVGEGSGPRTNQVLHALLWTGSAESVVDLHGFVPSKYEASAAYGVNADGHIVGFVADDKGIGCLAIWIPVLCPFILEGDLNSDCEVDFRDFARMAQSWLKNCKAAPDDPACVPRF
ncbi:MAG: hypothetical protein ACYS8Z_14720 [Planctomycetota bacterium]